MTIDLTKILLALIDLLAVLVTYKLIPWIKANTTAKQQAILKTAVQTAVFAAEQIYGANAGPDKFKYVEDWLLARGYSFDKADIESAVYECLNMEGLIITQNNEIDK